MADAKEWQPPPPGMKPTVVMDFDGVIHAYTTGWKGVTVIADGLTPGAVEAIAKLRTRYRVVVCSSRANSPEGRAAIEVWLEEHGIEVDAVASGEKPAGVAYVDDRAIRFEGTWEWVDDFVVLGAPRPWCKRTASDKDVGPGHKPMAPHIGDGVPFEG